jgi:hypothetical protein
MQLCKEIFIDPTHACMLACGQAGGPTWKLSQLTQSSVHPKKSTQSICAYVRIDSKVLRLCTVRLAGSMFQRTSKRTQRTNEGSQSK